MADDIDIEEHDIMQNPRMKGYLADLHIKDEPHNDHSLIDADSDCSSPGMVFPEGESDDSDHDEVQDTRKFSFEPQAPIILGSKPPSIGSIIFNPEIVLKNTVICLKDCSEQLNNSPSYCKECQTLFPTQNALDSHNMSMHSFLVAMVNSDHENNMESPVCNNFEYTKTTGKLCSHCNKYFKDDSALIQHMYEELEGKKSDSNKGQPFGNVTVGEAPVVDNINNIFWTKGREKEKKIVVSKHLVYYCNVCTCYYKTLKHLQAHISTNHKVRFEKFYLEPFLKQCKLCPVVTTFKNHNLHVKVSHKKHFFGSNVKNTNALKMPAQIDNGAAGSSDSHKDTSQTKVTKVYPVKTLDKVKPGTSSHQKYKLSTKVIKSNPVKKLNATVEEKVPLVKCTVCETTYINRSSARMHNVKYHPDKNTLVYIGPNVPATKKSTPQYLVLPPKDVIYKCGKCGLHFLTCIVVICHNISNTKNDICSVSNPWTCPECNKTFRKSDKANHELQHQKSKDIRCFEYHDQLYSRILCKCALCNIYFEERTFLKHHKYGCKGDTHLSEYCYVCDIRVNNISAHMLRHMDYTKSDFILINDFITINESQGNSDESKEASNSQKIMELKLDTDGKGNLKRKSPVNSSENVAKKAKIDAVTDELDILYNCTACNLSTGSYDDIIDHCQKHISIANYKPVTQICNICVMEFEGPCLNKHNSKPKILRFDYKDLLNDHWFKPFASVLEVQLNKIKSGSKYVTRGVKMNLILDGQPEHTLYKCETCKNYVDPSIVFSHTHTSCDAGNFPCESCGIKFSSKIGIDNHENIHNKINIDTNSYRIVTFKNKLDTSFNKKLKTAMDTTIASDDEFENELGENIITAKEGNMLSQSGFEENKKDSTTSKSVKIIEQCAVVTEEKGKVPNKCVTEAITSINTNEKKEKVTSIVFFQCDTCKCCMVRDKSMLKHKCMSASTLKMVKCRKCDYVVSRPIHMRSHIKWHSMNKHVTKEEITFKPFGKIYTYYMCEICKILLNSKHHECGQIRSKFCHMCKYKFPMSFFNTHINIHMRDPKFGRHNYNIIPFTFNKDNVYSDDESDSDDGYNNEEDDHETERRKNVMYECASCKCIFATKADFCSHHRRRKCSTKYGQQCKECGLTFDDNANDKHKHRHQMKMDLREESLKIITLTHAGMKDYTIFKCNKCKIHFINRTTLRLHLKRGHNNPKGKRCKRCGLKFSVDAFDAHLKEYHDTCDYRKEDFNIICFKTEINRLTLHNNANNDEPVDLIEELETTDLEVIDSDEIKKKTQKTSESDDVEEELIDIQEDNEDEEGISIGDSKKEPMKIDENETDRLASHSNSEIEVTPKEFEHSETDVISEESDHINTDANQETNEIDKDSKHSKTDTSQVREDDMVLEKCGHTHIDENQEKIAEESEHNNDASQQTKATPESEANELHQPSAPLIDSMEKSLTDLKNTNVQAAAATKLEVKDGTKTKDIFQLYKCGACNIYFMKQVYCYRHVAKHEPLDPLSYIACKLCSFQFPIEYLKEHMQKHHGSKKFDLDKVLIKEYSPGEKDVMKFERYYAKDKVQSRLVSTTTDDKETKDTSSLLETISTSSEDVGSVNAATDDILSSNKPKDKESSCSNTEGIQSCNSKMSDVNTEAIEEDKCVIGKNIMVNVPVDGKTELTLDIPSMDVVRKSSVFTSRNLDSPRTYARKKEKAKTNEKIGDSPKQCKYCNESFLTIRAKEFHESLDHLDAIKECPMCKVSFNESILNELHLKMSGDKFTCCICGCRCNQEKMPTHASFHNASKVTLNKIALLH